MLKIFLIRHAQSSHNKTGIAQGSDIDSELSEEGLEQAKKLAKRLQNENIIAIYCSDLKRSFGTAKILSNLLGTKIIQDHNLRELKIGDWSGITKDPLDKWIKYYDEQKKLGIPREEIRPPNGENSWDHMARIKKFLESIKNIDGNIIVVAHSGTNKVFIGTIKGTDPDEFYTFKQDNVCINEIVYKGKKWKVKKINDTSHLL